MLLREHKGSRKYQYVHLNLCAEHEAVGQTLPATILNTQLCVVWKFKSCLRIEIVEAVLLTSITRTKVRKVLERISIQK